MKRTNSARTLSLCPLAASLAIAFAVLATIEADARPQPGAVRTHDVVVTPPPSPRGPIVVTNCDDDGPGSLRQAYRSAASDDTIDSKRRARFRDQCWTWGVARASTSCIWPRAY